ncbi:MAG TPA: hypothetical protein VIU63_11175 [Nitrospira sp.]
MVMWCIVVLVAAGIVEGQAAVPAKKLKESTSGTAANTVPKPSNEQKSRRPNSSEKKKGLRAVPEKPVPVHANHKDMTSLRLKSKTSESLRHSKLSKKTEPKAILQPTMNPAFHGMLQDSQRYDARLNRHTTGLRNPQTDEFVHDHMQELDRNRDGKVDPVERVFGRLDMDRDLQDRQQ